MRIRGLRVDSSLLLHVVQSESYERRTSTIGCERCELIQTLSFQRNSRFLITFCFYIFV